MRNPFRRVKVNAPMGLGGAEFELEARTVKPDCIRYFDKQIKGVNVTIVVVNRKDGFKILKLMDDGVVEPLYEGGTQEDDGE
jgi:hypothetical protein